MTAWIRPNPISKPFSNRQPLPKDDVAPDAPPPLFSWRQYAGRDHISEVSDIEGILDQIQEWVWMPLSGLVLTLNEAMAGGLKQQLCLRNGTRPDHIAITSADNFMQTILDLYYQPPKLIKAEPAEMLLKQAITAIWKETATRPETGFFRQEIDLVIKAEGLTASQYEERRQAEFTRDILSKTWQIYRRYEHLLAVSGSQERADLPLLTLRHLEQQPMTDARYDRILVCEVNAFTAVQLQVVEQLLRE